MDEEAALVVSRQQNAVVAAALGVPSMLFGSFADLRTPHTAASPAAETPDGSEVQVVEVLGAPGATAALLPVPAAAAEPKPELGFVYERVPWSESRVSESAWGAVRPRQRVPELALALAPSVLGAVFADDDAAETDGAGAPRIRWAEVSEASASTTRTRRREEGSRSVRVAGAVSGQKITATALDLLRLFEAGDWRYRHSPQLEKIREAAYRVS